MLISPEKQEKLDLFTRQRMLRHQCLRCGAALSGAGRGEPWCADCDDAVQILKGPDGTVGAVVPINMDGETLYLSLALGD
jgi:hypothetical protein